MTKHTLPYATIAFISGFGVLAVEIAGARLISGTLGNSIYTWSTLIAAVLLSLSAGNFFGGWLIDRKQRIGLLVGALIISAATTALVPVLAEAANRHVLASQMSMTEGALYVSALVFILPSFFYGTISPLCVKLLVSSNEGQAVGTSAGIVSMAGSLGSFLGALATPFLLMPYLRLNSIFFLIAGIVLACCLLLFKPAKLSTMNRTAVGIGILLFFFAAQNTRTSPPEAPFIFDQNTPYHRIRVEDKTYDSNHLRFLMLDTTLEGGIFMGDDTRLPLDYQNSWQLAKALNLNVKRVLCIGAGAFGVPQQLSRAYPEAMIDVIEIDPEVIAVGHQFFNLSNFPRVNPIEGDGRAFLNRAKEKYNLIFIDAYHGLRYIPPHLTTTEFFDLCKERLADNGLVLMNIISSVTGESNRLFQAFATTVESAFPNVGAVPINPRQPDTVQNVVLVAAREKVFETNNAPIIQIPKLEPLILTDQLNPIETILAQQLKFR